MDYTKYPDGMDEIIKHMDFMEDDYAARKGVFWAMINLSLFY